MRKSFFSYCLACGIPLPGKTSDLYCEDHRQSAERALARIAWGTGLIPRIVVLLIILGIAIASSL